MITVQALQADGTWAVRNAFITENKMLDRGIIKAAELDTKARAVMARWQATSQDGKQLRVHNSANDPKPEPRKPTNFEKLHHVYCDATGAAVVTPDHMDAKRSFDKFCRDFPDDEVTWDRCDEFDPELGALGSVRFMLSVPDRDTRAA